MNIPDPKRDKLKSIIRGSRRIAKMTQAAFPDRKSDALYYRMLGKYYERLMCAHDDGKIIAAHTVFFPAEVLYAMDVVPMHTEATTWMITLFTGESSEIVTAGNQLGLAPEICTPHRGLAGAFSLGTIPNPDVMLWSNMVCDNTAKSGELITKMTGVPGFFLDRPFKQSDQEMNYLIKELSDMVAFLEKHSGKKMDWDRFSEIVTRMDKQIQLIREINELRKATPTPFSPIGFMQLLTAEYLFSGQPEAIEYLQALKDELSQMVKEGKGAVLQENFRLMSFFLPPMYLTSFLNKISQEYGAVSVTEPFFTFWEEGRLDPSKPLESVARKSYMIPEMRMYGPLDERALISIKTCAEQYKVDGAIYWADVGCRHACATIKIFKDLLNEIDVPVMTIDCDVVDPTITSEEEIETKLEQFFELLGSAKKATVKRQTKIKADAVGVEIGSLTTKAVILRSDDTIIYTIAHSGDEAEESAKSTIDQTLHDAGLSSHSYLPVVSTGTRGKSVSFSLGQQAINTCLARGINHLYPSVRTVIDLGAETSTTLKIDAHGKLLAWENQDKCASGTGVFLQQMAKLMAMPLGEMSEMSFQASSRAEISNTCAVFAESEVISHVHRVPPTPMPDIVAGIYASMVSRIMAMCKRLGVEQDVAIVGGVARIGGLIHILEEALNLKVVVPDEPQIIAALGAAIIARENAEEGLI